MEIVFFSTQSYDRVFFDRDNTDGKFSYTYFEAQLDAQMVHVIEQADVVCVFVNDKVDREVIEVLAEKNVKIIALRCAGFNNVDLDAAKEHGIAVCRVPAYSPEAVAEHTFAILLTLVRKTHKAYNRVREQNFMLNGLLGFNLHGRTIGIIGMGKIGQAVVNIALGFGCRVLAYDIYEDDSMKEWGVSYVSLEELYTNSDIISLHCPLTPDNRHMINAQSLALMKDGVILINTGRGALIDTAAVIEGLKSKKIGGLALDVYEQEEKFFFKDLSETIIEDDVLQRLMAFPNVLITAHQAFFTDEAMTQIAQTTLRNISELMTDGTTSNPQALLV